MSSSTAPRMTPDELLVHIEQLELLQRKFPNVKRSALKPILDGHRKVLAKANELNAGSEEFEKNEAARIELAATVDAAIAAGDVRPSTTTESKPVRAPGARRKAELAKLATALGLDSAEEAREAKRIMRSRAEARRKALEADRAEANAALKKMQPGVALAVRAAQKKRALARVANRVEWSKHDAKWNLRRRERRVLGIMRLISFRSDHFYNLAETLWHTGFDRMRPLGDDEKDSTRWPPKTPFVLHIAIPGEAVWDDMVAWVPRIPETMRVFARDDFHDERRVVAARRSQADAATLARIDAAIAELSRVDFDPVKEEQFLVWLEVEHDDFIVTRDAACNYAQRTQTFGVFATVKRDEYKHPKDIINRDLPLAASQWEEMSDRMAPENRRYASRMPLCRECHGICLTEHIKHCALCDGTTFCAEQCKKKHRAREHRSAAAIAAGKEAEKRRAASVARLNEMYTNNKWVFKIDAATGRAQRNDPAQLAFGRGVDFRRSPAQMDLAAYRAALRLKREQVDHGAFEWHALSPGLFDEAEADA